MDAWIGRVCAPHRLAETVHALWAAQEDPSEDAEAARAREKIKKSDRNLGGTAKHSKPAQTP